MVLLVSFLFVFAPNFSLILSYFFNLAKKCSFHVVSD